MNELSKKQETWKWKKGKVKNAFVRKNKKANEEDPVVLSLARSGVKIRDITTGEGQLAENYSKYNPVEPGDLLLNPMDLYSGANCSLSNVSGVISPAYINLRAKKNILPKFYDYYFKVQYWSMAFFANGKGVSFDNRWTLNVETLMNYPIPLPPFSEQQKIADFLDEKVKEIDNAIEKTKETIELYKKYKQAIITEAVTKGLDPNVEMKDSGVEWIGKIPVDWQVKRAKNVVTEFAKGAGITKEDVDINGDISCVRYGEIYTKYDIDFVQTFSRTNLSRINTPKYIEKGDILFSGTGELVEEIGKNIVYLGNEPCIAGGDIIIAKHKCNASFLNYAFKSSYSQMQKSSGKSKLKVVHISASDIGNILLAIPPACEQEAIANYLNQKIDLIDFINKSLNELVPMFENYKKSLIYEYATGKKEVK